MNVTLVKTTRPEETVTVGLRFEDGGFNDGHPLLSSEFEKPPSLQADAECSALFSNKQKHIASCLGSAFSGIRKLQTYQTTPAKCIITLLDGTHLQYESGVGFSLAAHIAAARLIGSKPRINHDEMCGWAEKS
jgi:hypothetical protein